MKRFLLAVALWLLASPAFAGISCALPFTLVNGVTADATQVMANYNALVACLNLAAHAGNNTDITSITGLTTPLAPAQGGSTVFVGGTGTLSGSTYTVTSTVPANYSLQKGFSVIFVANATNPGAVTLNAAGTGAINLFKQTTSGPVPMTGLEIQANDIVIAVYDGTQYQVGMPVNNTGPPTAGGRIVANTASCTGSPSIQYSSITAGTVLCYVPYLSGTGNLIWINGANFTYTTLTMTLNTSHQTINNVYDLFVIVNAGVPALCTGGNAWTTPTPTAPVASVNAPRNDPIAQNANGIWQNSGTLTDCWNGTTDFGPLVAGAATYLGTFFASANGQTIWQPSPAPANGGNIAYLGVWNAYNQLETAAFNGDKTLSYTFTGTNFWQNFGASLNERIYYVDGLGTTPANFYFKSDWTGDQSGVNGGGTSLCIDGTGTGVGSPTCTNGGPGTDFAPTNTSWATDSQIALPGTLQNTDIVISNHWVVVQGWHFAQALWVSQPSQKQLVASGNNGCCIQMQLRVHN
jgi:hypothetical protein